MSSKHLMKNVSIVLSYWDWTWSPSEHLGIRGIFTGSVWQYNRNNTESSCCFSLCVGSLSLALVSFTRHTPTIGPVRPYGVSWGLAGCEWRHRRLWVTSEPLVVEPASLVPQQGLWSQFGFWPPSLWRSLDSNQKCGCSAEPDHFAAFHFLCFTEFILLFFLSQKVFGFVFLSSRETQS